MQLATTHCYFTRAQFFENTTEVEFFVFVPPEDSMIVLHFTSLKQTFNLFMFLVLLISMHENILCRIFSPEAACEVIEAEKHSHVFYEAEPDIWMVMVRSSSFSFSMIHCFDYNLCHVGQREFGQETLRKFIKNRNWRS